MSTARGVEYYGWGNDSQAIYYASEHLNYWRRIPHTSPAKATRFWASWQIGEGDYLVIREQLFEKETVKSLYKKIEDFQKKKTKK